ncbi:MAG: aldehyde dehydrogenase family protein [Myxococcales bacterium]|nr:aldehyde dehydrogenase family protein [Polyangiaceae bacterium]MDW8251679.1 aldehyde dehydrogenase family protein [Myxococcales bacterium]
MQAAHVSPSMHIPSSRSIQVFSPANSEPVGEAPIAEAEAVRAAVASARRAQEAWGLLPVQERCERLLRFRDALVDRAEELVDLLNREAGKPRIEALLHEVIVLVDLTTWYAQHGPEILAPREVPLHLLKHRRAVIHYRPRGVIGIISPWNFPLVIPFGDAVAALVTGSAVVIKPSEVTPLIALKAKEIWDATGLSPDLLQVVCGYSDTGAALIDAGVQKVVFTGGVASGKRVAAACGERLIPCVMELGGKAPLIACADADLERTANAIVYGGFANSGQVCISVERVYAHQAIYDQLLDRVVELTKALRQGDPTRSEVEVGAIIFEKQCEIAEKHIEDALAKGAELRIGGKRAPGPGRFFQPTILAHCNHSMTVMTQEIFGPIVPFMKVADEDEALRLANDCHLGLNAYVFTSDRERGERIAERVEAGAVLVNDVFTNYPAEIPFGGIKQSGFGRIHGEDALRDLAETRTITVDRLPSPSRDPMWYPYSEKAYRWFSKGFRVLYGRGSVLQKLADLL